MRYKHSRYAITCLLLLGCGSDLGVSPAIAIGNRSELPLDQIELPDGFSIDLYARVDNARSMALGPGGTVFVGNRKGDSVWAVRDDDGDFRADRVVRLARGLDSPNGVAIRDRDLYVAEISRILRFPDIVDRIDDPPMPEIFVDGLPSEAHHGWKYIAFGPDGMLYVPIGAPCNICLSEDERFASILRVSADGDRLEIFARGVRNTVGFDWHPGTGDLWFTDNGRDWLGDNSPPDELNRAPGKGHHFGYPFCHGGDIADPDFGDQRGCEEFVAPEQNLGPHVAALGLRFYTGYQFPPEYRGQVLIAEHGSWNRSKKIGYRITLVQIRNGRAASYEVFAEGWLDGQKAWGRPVDLLQLPDGSILVSDDYAGAIYRISYASGN
ncbi:MAG: PQQ-dependent sugar dehydrogenase [Acidobacteria bacterium]|jgi:glucose/arabinose dehydrogenase|nr:PQQ-dependent sugar dehydrogenase [Acidobacteriota bacterium]